MPEWLSPARLVDLVIAITLLEALLLLRYRRHGLAAGRWLPNLASGLCLMLALRAVLADAAWPWMALCLAGAGLAHGLDLARLLGLGPRPSE